ncbi:MAG: TraB/GumN family protein [Erythrobacter sp.]
MSNQFKNVANALVPLALFSSATACAQTQTLPAPVPDVRVAAETLELAEAEPSGPALWQVSDEDTTIYLFGTIHALPPEIEWFDAEIGQALAASDVIVTEIEVDEATEAAMQQLVLSRGVLPPGTTLRTLLSDDQSTTYDEALGKLGLPTNAFDQLEPWLAGLTLTTLPLLQQGYSTDAGVEKVLIDRAGEIDRGALETIEFQIGIFDGLSEASQVQFLMEAAEGIDEIKPILDAMVETWVRGDADGLATLMNEGLTDPEVAEKLLFSRNRNWADWIDTRLDSPGTVFIAVGAGHLAGNNSVQDYLAEREIPAVRVQ